MLTGEEQERAHQVGMKVARQRGYVLARNAAVIGRVPTDRCAVIVIVVPVQHHTASHVHVVLEIQQKESRRVLHTVDVHLGEGADEIVVPASLFCLDCDVHHTYELVYEDDDWEEIDGGHVCEWTDFYFDEGDPKDSYSEDCTRTDTEWYESGFLLTGTAGWFCARHRAEAYEADIKAVRRARERAEKQKAESQA